MRGEIKTLLEFLVDTGKITKTENISEDIEIEYHIELEAGYSAVTLFQLQQLAQATDTHVEIWFNEREDDKTCTIDLQVMRHK